jgi:steroid delta-isomerase-like uncharacterized protein
MDRFPSCVTSSEEWREQMSAKTRQVYSDGKVRIFEQIVEAANRHDARGMSRHFAEDGVYENVTLRALGTRQTQQEFHEALFKSFPDLSYKLTNLLAGDDQLVAECLVKGTNQGAFLGRPPTGMAIKLPVAFVIKFSRGKIKHWKSYYDSGTLLRQLGA